MIFPRHFQFSVFTGGINLDFWLDLIPYQKTVMNSKLQGENTGLLGFNYIFSDFSVHGELWLIALGAGGGINGVEFKLN